MGKASARIFEFIYFSVNLYLNCRWALCCRFTKLQYIRCIVVIINHSYDISVIDWYPCMLLRLYLACLQSVDSVLPNLVCNLQISVFCFCCLFVIFWDVKRRLNSSICNQLQCTVSPYIAIKTELWVVTVKCLYTTVMGTNLVFVTTFNYFKWK